jgi:hypothetical protein
MVTFAGFDEDLGKRQLSPDQLLAALVQGWKYLIRRDPRTLQRIVKQQEPFFEWAEYKVAGTPTSPC